MADVVVGFAEEVRPVADVAAFYAGGSLATGDFQPGVSDLDLVALVQEPLGAAQQDRLRSLHAAVMRDEPRAAKLHCVYAPVADLADVDTEHLTWAHGELYRRPFSGVARAEILRHGITVYGPPPEALIPPVSPVALDAAVRAELSGYWSKAVAKPHLWLQDVYVDLGLLTLARAEATLTEGRLITKREALPRLPRFGVAVELVREIEKRREGQPVVMSVGARLRRARHARKVMTAGIRTLLAD